MTTDSKPLSAIRRKILVLSGKGGVGKSTVAANLALALARAGHRTGLLDVDLHGPSIPRMLNLEGATVEAEDQVLYPVQAHGLRIMSAGFLLADPAQALIWRGPMKMKLIRQFIENVAWEALDCLVIDCPPGTGDEPLAVCQLAAPVDGALVVTTPQDVATADVRRSLTFCRHLQVPVIGMVENMSGFACPHCGTVTDIFKAGGGQRLADEAGVPFLGRIPIDPAVAQAGDTGPGDGTPRTPADAAFAAVAAAVLAQVNPEPGPQP
jgi:ATP-binding protein involved in chromosome partitioning